MRKALSFALLILLLASCSEQKKYLKESGTVFHTLYNITYESPDYLTKEIDNELQTFSLSLNPFNPRSIIAKVNRNEAVVVDAVFTRVFEKAQEVSERSGGMFDITCAPLINAWGFGFSRMDSVTPAMIDSIKQFVGYQKVRLDKGTVRKTDPRVMLNCSSIAKGCASDVVASLLERKGVANYLVEIGGEVVSRGVNAAGRPWTLGISKPEDETNGYAHGIMEDKVQTKQKIGMATSGNYRNFYIKEGKKYAHTIDPRTGYPSEQDILSATVIAPDCMTADAYATAFMALGTEAAERLAAQVPEIAYYFIFTDKDGKQQIAFSDNMKRYMPGLRQTPE